MAWTMRTFHLVVCQEHGDADQRQDWCSRPVASLETQAYPMYLSEYSRETETIGGENERDWLIIRNWLSQLWTPASFKIFRVSACSRSKRANVLVPVQRQEKSQRPSLKAIRQEEFSLTWKRVRLFVLFRPSINWMRPTHIREGNLLYSVYQVWISFRGKENVAYIYNGILHSHKKEWNIAICNDMDGLGGYYAKWNKLTEKNKYYMISLICGL